jgi:phosphoribosyl 1,2-cyclic phosphodiesterase/CheY-like chemotaxis protein
MHVRFFGTRGSIATPGPHTLRYGGNTSCVEVRSNAGTLVVLDMGTGAAVLGRELIANGVPPNGHVLISHTHWDHIQGIPFFVPFKLQGSVWDIYAPRGFGQTLREILSGQMQYEYFPIALEQLGATIRYHELVEGRFRVGDIEVTSRYLNHPALTLGYRLAADGVEIVYACDHEPHARGLATGEGDICGEDRRHAEFLAGSDLVLHDAQYLASEYPQKVGWGHSTVEYALAVARFAGARRLGITHHDPLRHDSAIDELVAFLRSESRRKSGPEVFAAAEGGEVELSARACIAVAKPDFPAQAGLGPALIGRSALLVIETPSKLADLSDALRADDVHVITAALDNAPAVAARERPMLALVEDTGDNRPIVACRAIRRFAGDGDELPIVLVTSSEQRARDMEGGFTDFLVEPYSPVYARTRLRAWLMRAACHWVRAPTPNDEERRLAVTRALGLIETPPEERFDRITRLAAALFDVPIALIALMERDREWFKSVCGLEIREVLRDDSFCSHAIFERQPLVVVDALQDERFADNPYVTGPPGVRFYAGHPLILSNECCVGTLCILDTKPRHLDESALRLLGDLAQFVVREMDPKVGLSAPESPLMERRG